MQVLTRQAETVFEDDKYHESAMYYAITQNSFEDIALKFIRKGQEGALRTFLQKKITSLKVCHLETSSYFPNFFLDMI